MSATPEPFSLHTERLLIRPFSLDDLDAIHPILNAAFGEQPRAERRDWLAWTVMNYTALARLYQPPFGDRAIVLRAANTLIGAVGFVPSYGPFDLLRGFGEGAPAPSTGLHTHEMGLFWALGEPFRGHGYATEAARAMVEHAFDVLRLKRVVATTEHDNAPSVAVMRRLGMTILRNPSPTPEWFQTIGVLANPALHT